MKLSDELRNAFPQPDPNFVSCVRRTLYDLASEEEKEKKTMKHVKLRAGALIAAAVLVLSTIAVAAAGAKLGIFDFLRRDEQPAAVLPQASAMVQTQVPQSGGQVEDSSFALSMREAIYDGNAVHMVVEAKPASDSTLLIGPDCMISDKMSFLGLDSSETVAEYASAHGKTSIQRISIYDNNALQGMDSVVSSLDYRLEDDGTLVFIVSGSVSDGPASLPVDLICVSYPVNSDDSLDESQRKETVLSFSLSRSDVGQDARTFSSPTAFASAGVTVEKVELKSSPMGIYYTIECSVSDKDTYLTTEDGVSFRFLDGSGNIIDMAPATTGETTPVKDNRFTEKGTLVASESLPDSITLQCFNCWTKEVYETLTIDK
jgi:hypothetical protein